jgi:MFS family permease
MTQRLQHGLPLHTRKFVPAQLRKVGLTLNARMTQGAFVLVSGRIGAVYGHKNVLFTGGAWWIIWSLINGFCTGSIIPFAIARAMSGIGAAFVMPNAVAIIGITFPPGRMRNLSLGFFGFGAPVGGTLGCVIIALFTQWASWRWFFVFL